MSPEQLADRESGISDYQRHFMNVPQGEGARHLRARIANATRRGVDAAELQRLHNEWARVRATEIREAAQDWLEELETTV